MKHQQIPLALLVSCRTADDNMLLHQMRHRFAYSTNASGTFSVSQTAVNPHQILARLASLLRWVTTKTFCLGLVRGLNHRGWMVAEAQNYWQRLAHCLWLVHLDVESWQRLALLQWRAPDSPARGAFALVAALEQSHSAQKVAPQTILALHADQTTTQI